MFKNRNIKFRIQDFIKLSKVRVSLILVSNKKIKLLSKNGFHRRLLNDHFIQTEWDKADSLVRNGRYHEGVSRMKKVLLELQDTRKNFSSNTTSPIFLSHHWATRFGHLGQLGMKLKFNESFRDQKLPQKIYIKDKKLFAKFEKLFSNRIIPVYNINLLDFERPGNWDEFDLLYMSKFKNDFIEHNAMHELVYSNFKVDQKNPLVLDSYTRSEFLARLGLNQDDWYVALHIRKTNYRFDERQVNQYKFNQALEAVIKAGGKVIQFGIIMTKVKLSDPSKVMYLDEMDAAKSEETSLIAHSRFLLTTSSGPIGVAHALGVPVLQTDSPAICMHSKSASVGTLYLPKKLIKKSKPVTYSELAETGLGYTHISLAEWSKRGIQLVENSSTEILEATLEMLSPRSVNSSFDKRLESLRKDLNVLARGNFANSYLEQNNWMLE